MLEKLEREKLELEVEKLRLQMAASVLQEKREQSLFVLRMVVMGALTVAAIGFIAMLLV